MKYFNILILLIALLILSSCSGDKTDKPLTQLAPVSIETKPLALNTPNAQDLQPDLHLSGTQGTHISGASVTKHVSGQ